jgi:uncharacterized protein
MILTVYVKPNAHLSKIIEWVDEDTIKISLNAVPENGKANKELIRFLSKEWGIAKSEIVITRGLIARIKQLTLDDKHLNTIKRSQTDK